MKDTLILKIKDDGSGRVITQSKSFEDCEDYGILLAEKLSLFGKIKKLLGFGRKPHGFIYTEDKKWIKLYD